MKSISAILSIIFATVTIAQGSPIRRNLKLVKREIHEVGQRKLEEEYASSKAPYYEYYNSKSPTGTSTTVASASSVSYFNMNYIKENKKYHPVGIMIGVVAGISFIVLTANKAKRRKVNNTQLAEAICEQDHDLESRFDSVAKLTETGRV